MTPSPIPRETLIRWPAVAQDGVALGPRVIGCGCPIDGVCERQDCPQRPEEEKA
jgi:predicted transcriptional regulator